MRFVTAFVASAVLLFPALVLAHGGGEHVMGTIKSIDDKGALVETKDSKDVQITFDDKTQFERSGAPSSAKELHAGDRVVVHCVKADGSGHHKAAFVKSGAAPTDGHDGAHKAEGHGPQ
jgi:ribosomal protein S1